MLKPLPALKSFRVPWILGVLPIWFTDAYHYRRYWYGCRILQENFPAMADVYKPVHFTRWRVSFLNPRMPRTAEIPS